MTKPKNAPKKVLCATDQNAPLRARIRLVFQPGMTITEIARKTHAEVAKVKEAVQKLRKRGEITCDVPHNQRGHAMRMNGQALLVTAEMRANFRRAVPDDMRAQIDAKVKELGKNMPTLTPGGQTTFFGQALSNRPYPSMEVA